MRQYLITAAILTAGLITGCGGSGSGNSNITNPGTAKSVVAGAVADGYLVNATVFLDKNNNYLLDSGEPFATTDQNGAFTMEVDPADVGKYPIVAIAIAGQTYDLDNPAQKLQNSYVMSMHAVSVVSSAAGTVTGSVSNFISPISTQIREMIESGKYATVQGAATALRTELGMPLADMTGNYIANRDEALHAAAMNMASLMGGQMSQIMTMQGNSLTSLDANRYRIMIGTIFSNMSAVRTRTTTTQQNTVMTQLQNRISNTVMAAPMVMNGNPFMNFSTLFRHRTGNSAMNGK